MKSQLYLNSSLELNQKEGSLFNLSKANISFDKDATTTIDSIGIAIYEGDRLLAYRTIIRGDEEVRKMLSENVNMKFPYRNL